MASWAVYVFLGYGLLGLFWSAVPSTVCGTGLLGIVRDLLGGSVFLVAPAT